MMVYVPYMTVLFMVETTIILLRMQIHGNLMSRSPPASHFIVVYISTLGYHEFACAIILLWFPFEIEIAYFYSGNHSTVHVMRYSSN